MSLLARYAEHLYWLARYIERASSLARIVEIILQDERSILTVCTPLPEIAGVTDVTVAMPHLLGGAGIVDTFPLPLNKTEQRALHNSAAVIRDAIDGLDAEMSAAAE